MKKDDAPIFWKTPALNESQSVGVEQLACPPFSMVTDTCYITRTSTPEPHNRKLEQIEAAGKAMHTTNIPLGSIQ